MKTLRISRIKKSGTAYKVALHVAHERIANRVRRFSTHAQGSIFSKDYLETLSEGLEW